VHPDTWQPIIARLLQITSLSDDDDDDDDDLTKEESVFWLFTALTETLLPLDYFQLQTVGALIDTKLVQQLLAVRMPDLSRHLGTLKFSFTRVEEWLRSLFAGEARFDTLCRIWDLLFARGHVGLIQTVLAVFSILEKRLLTCSRLEEVCGVLEINSIDCNQLVQTAATCFLGKKEVFGLRARAAKELYEQMLHNKGETCVSLGVRCDWKWPICALNFQKWSVVSDCFVFATAVKNIDWNYIPDPG
jgi:hypothetical protein